MNKNDLVQATAETTLAPNGQLHAEVSRLLISAECRFCYGNGRIHSPGCNGDPDDDGLECPDCTGIGTVDVDLNGEVETL